MNTDEYTIQETYFSVGEGHELYIQEWGNKKAKTPIIFLHGGPGSQVKDKHKGVFDPLKHHVIFFDQRGCGKSLPYGSIEHNTTKEMIADITKIADHFKFSKFILVGGSWGCCLSLAYGLAHPNRVAAMVTNGIWTASKEETSFVDQGKFQQFFPDVWDKYLDATPKEHHKNPSSYHFKRILGNDQLAIKQSGYAYENLEGALLNLDDRYTPDNFEDFDPAGVRIEVHYLANNAFLPDKHILKNAHKLTMPIWMVQGRYDAVCPPVTAYKLHQKMPNAQLIWVTGGHLAERESWNVQRTILAQWS